MLTPQVEAQAINLVTLIVGKLAALPVSVQIVERGEANILIRVHSTPPDTGAIIGHNGHTASAIRTVLGCLARKHAVTIKLDITDTPN